MHQNSAASVPSPEPVDDDEDEDEEEEEDDEDDDPGDEGCDDGGDLCGFSNFSSEPALAEWVTRRAAIQPDRENGRTPPA